MKKFYAIFLTLPILFFTLLYLSIWWFIGMIAIIMIFIAYRFYATRLHAARDRNAVLEKELEELHERLEQSFLKEQRTNREVEQVRQMKKQLLSVISHEVRTPMNGIMGMALFLADTPLAKEQQEYLKTIRNCGESLLTTVNNVLVNDILDFSKLEQQGKLEYKDFDLRDCVEEVLEMFAIKAGKAGLDLLYDIDENVPAQIISDSSRLRQVLINLVENAVKFTKHGEIVVSIRSSDPGNESQLNFDVSDTGIGIASGQIKYLFKGIPAKESDSADTGLGLVICKKLVEFMGGHIEAKSKQGQGSHFAFSIPLTPSMKIKRNDAQQNNMINLQGKHILIVDDNAASLSILAKQVELWKMLPVVAGSGKQALEILSQNNSLSIILTDLNMPGMDGIELTKSIKNKYPSMPVILMNTAGDESYKKEGKIFSSVLTKPTRQIILRDHILNEFSQTVTNKEITADNLGDDFSKQYPLRILIAEDNLINQKIAVKILTKLGYQPALANNGKEALETVSNEHYDIILMDVQMPGMDGLEATRMIRTCLEIQPVIIAMTANVMQGDRDDCIQAGMDDYMSKPIDLKELLSQLEKWALVIKERRKISA
ncbi:MAG TPA: response regulator [Chitinophagaceae bacterium]|nr:response regulator [Chitinophagaceae bacterium]